MEQTQGAVKVKEKIDLINDSWKTMTIMQRIEHIRQLALPNVTFSNSFSLEDQLITHYIAFYKLDVHIFTLDTGRHFPEIYHLHQQMEEKYNIKISAYTPDRDALERFVNQKGINSFYKSVENRHECCHIRKVEPLKRAIRGKDYWITGLRAAHSETRQNLAFALWDEGNKLIKLNPVLDLNQQDLWYFTRKENIPFNSLYNKGFASIGCAPCTRAIEPGEENRAGRWWWEQKGEQECGLHYENGCLVRTRKTDEDKDYVI